MTRRRDRGGPPSSCSATGRRSGSGSRADRLPRPAFRPERPLADFASFIPRVVHQRSSTTARRCRRANHLPSRGVAHDEVRAPPPARRQSGAYRLPDPAPSPPPPTTGGGHLLRRLGLHRAHRVAGAEEEWRRAHVQHHEPLPRRDDHDHLQLLRRRDQVRRRRALVIFRADRTRTQAGTFPDERVATQMAAACACRLNQKLNRWVAHRRAPRGDRLRPHRWAAACSRPPPRRHRRPRRRRPPPPAPVGVCARGAADGATRRRRAVGRPARRARRRRRGGTCRGSPRATRRRTTTATTPTATL